MTRPAAYRFRSSHSLCLTLGLGILALGLRPVGASTNSLDISQELNIEDAYISGGNTHGAGNINGGSVSENSSDIKYVLSPQVTKDLLLRMGVEWQRFSFEDTHSAPIPFGLQQISAVIGADYQLGDAWLLRVEVEPGVYSDLSDIRWRDVDSPVMMGGAYLASADLQWFFGARLDLKSEIPFLPAGGVRWRMSENWTLNFQLPHPKLEYDVNSKLKLYLGGEVEAATFQMSQMFGSNHGQPQLNNALVDYLEFRLGPGLAWKCSHYLTISMDTGYSPYREFDYFRHDFVMRSHGGAYGEITCNAAF